MERRFLLLVPLMLVLVIAPHVSAWGVSIHHDQAGTIEKALKESPSIPQEVKERVDYDTIYAASLAPDDWRGATGMWGTYQHNMAENAYYEFRRIREAWANGGNDNAIYRIGIVLHYVGDAVYMPHNDNLRKWYRDHIPPLGSDEPLWADEESGKYFTAFEYFHNSHYNHQQAEAYTDSDSAWYPLRPENYGPTDNGSLEWFLTNYFYNPAIDNDSPNNDYGTVMGRHIRQTSPIVDWSPDDREDNRWFYWVATRDPDIPKMDADNTIRLTYNGVYRALRDGYRLRNGETPGTEPSAVWPWPTPQQWLAPRTYGNGMDTVRWMQGLTSGIYGAGASGQGAETHEIPRAEETRGLRSQIVLLAVASCTLILTALALCVSRRHRSHRTQALDGT